MHGGIGKRLNLLEEIASIKRPLEIISEGINEEAQIVLDILWSDPTDNDN